MSVARNNGFSGGVDIMLEGAPSGVTLGVAALTISAASSAASLDIDVAASVAPRRHQALKSTGSRHAISSRG